MKRYQRWIVLGGLLMGTLVSRMADAGVVINEIMYRSQSLQNAEEFIELFNSGTEPVDLSGGSLQNGVRFIFPADTWISAGGYQVVSASPDVFRTGYPGRGALGPYQGQLSNDGETLDLFDHAGQLLDSVTYHDEEGWPQAADGLGPSLERIHPDMAGSQPGSWVAGPIGGTPGLPNAGAVPKAVPLVIDVDQSPVVPHSDESVFVHGHILHPYPIQSVNLWYKKENDEIYESVPMHDDGENGDAEAQDGIYTGTIPPQPDGTLVEFAIQAMDEALTNGWFPVSGPTKGAIFRIDDHVYDTPLPLYRIVMRTTDETTLRTRSTESNDELTSTFIYGDEIYYNAGVRFRGKGSRHVEPKSYRINFSDTRYFGSVRKMNLNHVEPYRQYVGLETFRHLGMPVPDKQFVSLLFNEAFEPSYLQVERTDQFMMERLFGSRSGNLYRGIEEANLDYRGENPDLYAANYMKINNELENDYSDIVELCRVFSTTADDQFVPELENVINIPQWIRWFAIKEILNDREGGISLDRGDDYYIYHNPADGLFWMLPWDLDTVIVQPFEAVHHHGTPAVQRLLRHPELARFYYAEILKILDYELTQDDMNSIIDQTAPIAEKSVRDELKELSKGMRAFLYDSIPRKLTVQMAGNQSAVLIPDADTWRFFRGKTAPPMDWNQNGFDDSTWESGLSGFGYSDNDDRTVLDDMQHNYSTVFIRKTFTVANPENIEQLQLHVWVDDGFVAYLNGVEIARDNVDGEPAFDSFASHSQEADSSKLFVIDSVSSLLTVGINTLAVVGLNNTLDSSDLSLAVQLDAVLQLGDSVQLHGKTNAAETVQVCVNGQPAAFVPWQADWMFTSPLQKGRNLFTIESLNADGQVFDATTVVLYHQSQPPTDGRETLGQELWTADENPVQVNQNLIVPAGDTLTVEAGTEVRMAPGTSIIVYGSLLVQGASDLPVRFLSSSEGGIWGGIVLENAAGPVRIQQADFTQSRGFSFRGKSYAAVINISGSTVEISGCAFHDMSPTMGIEVSHSSLTLRGNTFQSMGEMLHCNNDSLAIVENNRFEHVIGYSDAIDFDGAMQAGSIIRGNTIIGSEDDGIDLGGTTVRMEGNWIEGCSDKGISLESDSRPEVVNCVISRCDTGVAVKDDCHAWVAHSTIVSCTSGVRMYEKNEGQGGGFADVVNCVIWNTQSSVLMDNLSLGTVEFCDLMQLPESFSITNFSRDPLFTNSGEQNYRPEFSSPLIDAGSDAGITTDYLGEQRPSGKFPDIGAYEMQPITPVIDWTLLE